VFVENNGQFPAVMGARVLYALDNGLEKIYFTNKGLVYEMTDVHRLTERDREEMERGKKSSVPDKKAFVTVSWIGADPDLQIDASLMQQHYFSYGEKKFNSHTFKRLLYKNVWKDIDIEYIIPEDKINGVKYSVILHPGSDPTHISMKYSGDVRRIREQDGNIKIITEIDDLTEHAPVSFDENGQSVASLFTLTDDIIGFKLPDGYDPKHNLIIDPWVSTTATLTSNSYAYDVDYDFLMNTYVYGGYNPFKVACYSVTGALQWTFMGTVGAISWSSAQNTSQPSNFGVNRFNGKTYIGQGFNSTGNRLVRIDNLGNYDNWTNTVNSLFQETWDMGFHCLTADVFILGGTTNSNISAATVNSVTGTMTLSTFQPLITPGFQDIICHAIDDAANIFVIYGSGLTANGLNNKITRVNGTFNGNTWTSPCGFSNFGEQQNKTNYVGGGSLSSNGFNALAVNANYLFYYDGLNLVAYNKTTAAIISSVTVPLSLKQQGGIAVDDCSNLYLGGNGNMLCYNFSGTSFSTLTPIPLGVTTTNQYVYDIKLDKNTKILYVSGSGFAGVYSPVHTIACPTASSACLFSQGAISILNSSITCASLGSATCTAIGGVGPFTYTWLPSMQTGSVASGLAPGTHAIVVNDIGANITYTATTYIAPVVPLTFSIASQYSLNCFGMTTGTVSINNLAGGSGTQNYFWTNGTLTQTTAVANIAMGNYTVTVTDALTACMASQTFTVSQPPALTLNVVPNATTACTGSSITLTPLIGGGTPNYTYSWTAGPATGVYATTQSTAGNYVYTLTAFDSRSCAITFTNLLNFVGSPTLSVSDVSICPLAAATLSVSGAQTFTWFAGGGNTSTGPTLIVSPASTTIYTVSGSAGITTVCISSATVAVILKSIPVPTLTSNSPVCTGSILQMAAAGGTGCIWTGPQLFTSTLQQPSINLASTFNSGAYNVTVTAANGCTASASQSLVVRAAPPVTALGSTACVTQTLTLNAGSTATGVTFQWTGPLSYNSQSQNVSIPNPPISASGNYTVVVTDPLGCTNSAIANVAVIPMPVAFFVTNSPQCENSLLQLNASGSSGALSYSWLGPNGFASNVVNPQITNVTVPATGIYTVSVTTGPCTASTTRSVTIFALPTLTVTGNPGACESESLALSMMGSAGVTSYQWKGPAAFLKNAPSFTRSPALLSFSGTYTATVTDLNGCANSATLTAKVYPRPVLAVSNATVCLMQPALLKVNGASSYFWTGPGSYQSLAANAVINSATNIAPAIYTVVGSSANSCTQIATATVMTLPLPTPKISVAPSASICLGDKVTLNGSGGWVHQWRGPDNLYYEGNEITLDLKSMIYSGLYTLTAVDNNGCIASVSTSITVLPLPDGNLFGSSMEACVPFCSDFVFSPSSKSVSSTWKYDRQVKQGASFQYCVFDEGDHVLQGSFYDAVTKCSNTADFHIIGHPKPIADFNFLPENPIENSDEVVFENTSQGEEIISFSWSFPPKNGEIKSSSATGPSTRYLFETAGIYPVALTVSNAWKCSDTIVKAIHVEEDFLMFVPNAFTPNADGKNETFKPVGRGYKLYQLRIFDRWGQLIFQSSDFSVGWDGTFKDEPCKSDVYTWTISVSSKHGEIKKMTGHVNLLR
jgi:gliding motility-associated-like protein